MTLLITRRVGQRIMIGDSIVITVVRAGRDSGKVTIAIDAPSGTLVLRAELLDSQPKAPTDES